VGGIVGFQKSFAYNAYFPPSRWWPEELDLVYCPKKTLCKYLHCGTPITVNMGMEDSGNQLIFKEVAIFWHLHWHCVTEFIARIWLKVENICAPWKLHLCRYQRSTLISSPGRLWRCIRFGVFGNTGGHCTGGGVAFTLPHVFAQPPCF